MIGHMSMTPPTCSWPVRPTAEERRRLGRSIWLFLLLTEWAENGVVRSGDSVRVSELAQALEIGPRQARRELHRLRQAGYLSLQNTGRGFRIQLAAPAH